MRLIDADALVKWLDVGKLRSTTDVCFCELDILRILDVAATIDAEPVRHGRWIVEDIVIDNNGRTMPDWPRCSECDRQSDLEYDYCPNCGAKMDEEVQHG